MELQSLYLLQIERDLYSESTLKQGAIRYSLRRAWQCATPKVFSI